ncbi:DUF397 domain-containing protein [Streptomyces prunicolor]
MPTHLITSELAPDQAWFKSSYSDAGQNCIEAAMLLPAAAWTPFLTHIQQR